MLGGGIYHPYSAKRFVLRALLLLALPTLFLVLPQAAASRSSSAGQAAEGAAKYTAYDAGGGVGRRVLVVPIEGDIDPGRAAFVQRAVAEADAKTTLVFRVTTFGGRVDSAVAIRDAILGASAPTVAFVEGRAISAGALISLSADTLLLTPGASIGAATPVQQQASGPPQPTSEKVVSYMRAEMRATAEAKGRRADLAEAMVDAALAVEGVVESGKLLTLTAAGAAELGLADAVVGSLEEALELLNLGAAERQDYSSHWGEELASFLTAPALASLLMSLGFLGLMIELYTPGLGWAGALGLLCLGLFFGGHLAADLAGLEDLLLFAAGVALLLVEALVIPGFGLAGIAGLTCIGVSLVLAMVRLDLPWGVAGDLGLIQGVFSGALLRLGFVTLLVLIGFVAALRFVPQSRFTRFLVFRDAEPRVAPAPATAAGRAVGSLPQIGATGRALSALRPAGVAEFGGRRVHVTSDGEWIDSGSQVEVLSVDGERALVRRCSASAPASSA